MAITIKTTEPDEDPKYLTCCKKIHVVDASFGLAIIKVIVFLLSIWGALLTQKYWIFTALTFIVPSVLTIVGIHFWKNLLLIPAVVVDVVVLISPFLTFGFVVAGWLGIIEYHLATAVVVSLIFFSLVGAWMALVDFRTYQYVKERPAVRTMNTVYV